MQRGSLAMVSRKEAPSVWQFRWSEKDLHGVRVLQGEGKSTETKRDTNKGTKTCPFGSSMVSGEFVQLF
jgi:hypothetical protein